MTDNVMMNGDVALAGNDMNAYRADAIRYAVLRKIAPGLRHVMMGELQSIQLAADLATRLLRPGADIAKARDNVVQIPAQCAIAVNTCRAVIAWMRPEEDATIAIGDGLARSIKVATDDWFLRGLELRSDVEDASARVRPDALQELVVTALLVLADRFAQPADLQVSARASERYVDVTLNGKTAARAASFPPASQYRLLAWTDLAVLAAVHDVRCECENTHATLQFQRMDAIPASGDAEPVSST